MAQLPADVNAGDPGHSDHHDVLHATHNALDALSVGEIPVRSAGGFDATTVAAIVAAAKAGNFVTDTITGNDVLTSWDVAHNLGVANVRVALFRADGSQVDDDQYDFVPTVGNTLNSTTITIPEGTPGGPLPNGVVLTVYVGEVFS